MCPALAHQDTKIRWDGDKLIGLDKAYAPASFNFKKKELIISGHKLELHGGIKELFPELDAEGKFDGKVKFTASWYHRFSLLPPYMVMEVVENKTKYNFSIMVDISAVKVLRVSSMVGNREVDINYKVNEQVDPRFTYEVDKALLLKLKEPDLAKKKDKSETVRLLHLPDFGQPLSIRAYSSIDGFKMRIVRLSGESRKGWESIVEDKTVKLTKEQWMGLKKRTNVEGACSPRSSKKTDFEPILSTMNVKKTNNTVAILETKSDNGHTYTRVNNVIVANKTMSKEVIENLRKETGYNIEPISEVCNYLMELAKPHINSVKPELK